MPSHAEDFFSESGRIYATIDTVKVEALAAELTALRDRKGRRFVIGVGVGVGAANCSHAINDVRKLCSIETRSPVDNVRVDRPRR